MRLEITRRADLAVRAMATLDRAGRMKGSRLAVELRTTAAFVPQVVAPLVRAGWLRSDPGPAGGYSLAVALDGLSVLDVIEAVDGPTDHGRCVVEDRDCRSSGKCMLHDAWAHARGELTRALAGTAIPSLGPSAPATLDTP